MLLPLPHRCPRCNTVPLDSAPFCRECKLDLRHESPDRGPPGLCTYCSIDGPNPRQKITKEHLFGKWLKRTFPPVATYYRETFSRPERHEIGNEGAHVRIEIKKISPYDLQKAHVCEACNGGWMSELQNQAKPILVSLVTGEWPDLTDEQCHILARWCAMVSINIAKHLNIGIFEQFQLRALKSGEIPQGFHISAMRVNSPDKAIAGYFHQHAGEVPYGVTKSTTSIVATLFCIEETAFLVNHIPYATYILDQIQKYVPGVGRFPREIYPTNSTASLTKNVWLTPESLRTYHIEWALQPKIPVVFYGSKPFYRTARPSYTVKINISSQGQ